MIGASAKSAASFKRAPVSEREKGRDGGRDTERERKTKRMREAVRK